MIDGRWEEDSKEEEEAYCDAQISRLVAGNSINQNRKYSLKICLKSVRVSCLRV